jgi:hypothetical protein
MKERKKEGKKGREKDGRTDGRMNKRTNDWTKDRKTDKEKEMLNFSVSRNPRPNFWKQMFRPGIRKENIKLPGLVLENGNGKIMVLSTYDLELNITKVN